MSNFGLEMHKAYRDIIRSTIRNRNPFFDLLYARLLLNQGHHQGSYGIPTILADGRVRLLPWIVNNV